MHILVLGGTGAMGVPLTQFLAAKGHDIIVTTRNKRISKDPNIKYVTGNAYKSEFINDLLKVHYDAIIDFMVYDTELFRKRVSILLQNTEQYFFFSSSRVYANTGEALITEESPRLLETSKDHEFLATDEYALAKGREEDILRNSGSRNWTIIRPYITYNDERFQLGIFEKEQWLFRAVNGKAIVFGKDVASKYTTLTYGYDVSLRVADLVGKEKALGETVQITTSEYILWEDVLNIYLNVLKSKFGKKPKVCWVENMDMLIQGATYQLKYDRLYNRKFDNSKIEALTDGIEGFKPVKVGLELCLYRFLNNSMEFRQISWRDEAKFDRITGDKTRIRDIEGLGNKLKYVLFRYIVNETIGKKTFE